MGDPGMPAAAAESARPDEDDVLLDARLRGKPQVIVRKVGDWSMLIDVETGFTYEANRVGSLIWQLLGRPATLRQACAEVALAHEVAASTVLPDALGFARDLLRFGLLEREPLPPPGAAGSAPRGSGS